MGTKEVFEKQPDPEPPRQYEIERLHVQFYRADDASLNPGELRMVVGHTDGPVNDPAFETDLMDLVARQLEAAGFVRKTVETKDPVDEDPKKSKLEKAKE